MTTTSSPPRWRRGVINVCKLLATLVLFGISLHAIGQFRAPELPVDAPDFRVTTLEGKSIGLSELRGRPVILNFWATWCTPCRLEVPAFRRFAERHPEVHIVGVTADGLAQEIARVVEDLGITWTLAMPNPSVARLFKVDVYPTTVFIDPDGHVTAAHVGLLTDLQLAWLAW